MAGLLISQINKTITFDKLSNLNFALLPIIDSFNKVVNQLIKELATLNGMLFEDPYFVYFIFNLVLEDFPGVF